MVDILKVNVYTNHIRYADMKIATGVSLPVDYPFWKVDCKNDYKNEVAISVSAYFTPRKHIMYARSRVFPATFY